MPGLSPAQPPARPALDLSHRLDVARAHARAAWRPAPAAPPARTVQARVEGELVVLSADGGELDGDWSDPAVVQRALFAVVEGLRRGQPTLDPHFIVVLSTFVVDAPVALYLPLANDVRGIGYRHLEPAEVFRFTPGRLDGVLFMNGVRLAEAPLAEALFLQELGHRWGVYARLPDPDGTRLLGRDCAHWSAFVRTPGSAMEGNPWVADGAGRFVAGVPDRVGYSDAGRYLMGLLPAAAVPPIVRIVDDGWPCFDARRMGVDNPRAAHPTWRTGEPAAAEGALEPIDWGEVVAHEGPRAPPWTSARRRWSAAFVLAARAVDDPATALPIVERARLRWSAAFEAATDTGADRLTLDTTLEAARLVNPPGTVPFGGRCLDPVDCAAEAPRCAPTAGGDRICTRGCADHGDCPASACCVALAAGDAVCAPTIDPCPAVDGPEAGPDGGPRDGGLRDGGLRDGALRDGGLRDDGLPLSASSARAEGCAVRGPSSADPSGPALLVLGLGWVLRRRRVGDAGRISRRRGRRCGPGWR